MSYATQVLADGATHYWRLGEASGTVAADAVGGVPGTISGGVTLAQPGALADGDTAMTFNGTTGQVQTAASVALSPSWTIEAWIWPTVAGYGMAAGNVGDSGKDEWALGTADLSGTTVGMFAFRYGGGSGGSLQNPTGVLTLNAWHHLVVTWAAPNMALFLDGALSQPMTFVPGPTAIAGRVSIGQIPPPAYWAMGFTGGVDEVAIYPTALTPAQTAAHYAARTLTGGSTGAAPGVPPWLLSEDFMANSYNVCAPITPSDTVDFPRLTDAVMVGGGGDVNGVMQNGQAVLLKGLPAGAWVPVRFKRINAAATTATGLVALFVT